jgi:FKBP-type peptidyl-prolyl cis-trans isomerase
MRLIPVIVIAAALAIGGCSQGKVKMATLSDSASYAIGMNFAKSNLVPALKQGTEQGVEFNRAMIAEAIRDALLEMDPRLTDTVAQQALTSFQQDFLTKKGNENKEKGDAFLAENKKKEGVQVTPSGVQYKIKTEGSGESPDSNDVVKVEYKGTLVDGTQFDATPEGKTAELPVNNVIPGFSEALKMMKPGSEWTVYIPGELAYGERGGAGGKIGPNETLIFDVKLVGITRK